MCRLVPSAGDRPNSVPRGRKVKTGGRVGQDKGGRSSSKRGGEPGKKKRKRKKTRGPKADPNLNSEDQMQSNLSPFSDVGLGGSRGGETVFSSPFRSFGLPPLRINVRSLALMAPFKAGDGKPEHREESGEPPSRNSRRPLAAATGRPQPWQRRLQGPLRADSWRPPDDLLPPLLP